MVNKLFNLFLLCLAFISCKQEYQTIDTVARTEIIDYNLTDSEKVIVWHTNDFSLKLFRQLRIASDDSSFAFAPLSIACLLNLTNNGAIGKCSGEISEALGYQTDRLPIINRFFRKTMIAHYQQSVGGEGGDPRFGHDISMAGSLCLNEKFLDEARENYFITFTKDNKSIPLQKNEIHFYDVIHLDMPWMYPFYDCGVDSFFVSADSCLLLPMMGVDFDDGPCDYISNPEYTAIDIPLIDPFFHVLLMLPKEGLSVGKMLDGLSAKDFAKRTARKQPYENLHVRIPKFLIRNEFSFDNYLKKMGMLTLFSREADLSGIGGDVSHVKQITQKADIMVDEDGMHFHSLSTETCVLLGAVDEDSTIVEFIANHPFVYFLLDGFGNICLCGQYYGSRI